jgi:hypothetical protein
MATARAIRIGRPAREATPAVPPVRDRRPNRGGVQRAVRLSVAYVAGLAAVYGGFVAYSRSTSGGTTPGADAALLLFGELAAALAAAGAIVTVFSAPRAVELSDTETRVVSVFGWARRFPPLASVRVREVRRYGAGLFGPVPVVSTELTAGKLRRTYLLEEGLLPPDAGG